MRITKLGEEILRQKAEPVKPEEINDDLHLNVIGTVSFVLYEDVKADSFCKKIYVKRLFRLGKAYAFNLNVQKHFKEFFTDV